MDLEKSVSKLKFLSCKIQKDTIFEEMSLEDFINLPSYEQAVSKKKLFCPDCELARLTIVNGITSYFRTKKNSYHADSCGKAICSNIKNLNEVNEDSVEGLLQRILSNNNTNSRDKNMQSKERVKQKSISKYKTKSLNSISENDMELYYCYYARGISITLIENYETYNFLRLFKTNSNVHFLSIKIKKEYLRELKDKEEQIYDIAFFGKITVFEDHKDVFIRNPKFLKIL